jgi:hypothetical protein
MAKSGFKIVAKSAPGAPWDPTIGDIPPDPPNAPWVSGTLPTPADIIFAARAVWALRAGDLDEHAQALFDRAGPWLDHWRANRSAAETMSLAGIEVPDRAADVTPDMTPETALLAIAAAHRAIAGCSKLWWAIAQELAGESVLSIGLARVETLVVQTEALRGESADRRDRRETRDGRILTRAKELIAAGTSRRHLYKRLSAERWPDARQPDGDGVLLSVRTIRRICERFAHEGLL